MEQYIVVEGDSRKQLEYQVNEKIVTGYVPKGGVAVNSTSFSLPRFFQAMVLKDGNKS